MMKEEAVAKALEPKCQAFGNGDMPMQVAREFARAAIAAADEWEAQQRQPAISQGFDDALQVELDHPPASILGKE